MEIGPVLFVSIYSQINMDSIALICFSDFEIVEDPFIIMNSFMSVADNRYIKSEASL